MTDLKTQVRFVKSLPALKELHPQKNTRDFLFIVDKRVLAENPHVAQWLQKYPFVYPVNAGESLKNLQHLPNHLSRIFAMLGEQARRGLTLVAIGGGSVGDFSGFVASVFKRGIDFIQIPSSWLAAIDSAHGGKNGLNLGELKNQIGTFWHPSRVYVVERVLGSQSTDQFQDALGEMYKMALLTNLPWGRALIESKKVSLGQLRKYLPLAISEKYRIVKRDPQETKGLRYFLNLGHTFGHVIELDQGLPHGRAVAIGLKFALSFSAERGLMKPSVWQDLQSTPMFQHLDRFKFNPLDERRFFQILSQDKKKDSAQSIRFVFLKNLGKPLTQSVSINDLIAAGKKYGFIYNS